MPFSSLDGIWKANPPEGFEVKITKIDDISDGKTIPELVIPELVRKILYRHVTDPTETTPVTMDVFSKMKAYRRSDGIITYAATADPRSFLLNNAKRVLICVDYDPVRKDVEGFAEVEDDSLADAHEGEDAKENPLPLTEFETSRDEEGHHFAYPRLLIFNAYSYATRKRFIGAGRFTKHRGESGYLSRSHYAAGEHVWQRMKEELDKARSPLMVVHEDDTYYFAARSPEVAA